MKLIYIYIIVLLASCASVVTPDGGQKDSNPPKVKKTSVINNSTYINNKNILLEYDENIYVKNKENIIVNPNNESTFKVEANKNKLEIKFDTLEENTTYTIEIDNAIADINENNISNREVIVFSTGKAIDTTSVSGKVINIKDNNFKECYAYLFEKIINEDYIDSTIWKTKPKYKTKVKEDGTYTFKSVKKNTYNILIIRDLNKNNIPENNEEFGFCKEDIKVEENIIVKDIYIYNDMSFEIPKVTNFYCNEYGVFNFVVTPKNCKKKLIDNNLFTEEAYTLIFPGENDDTITWFSPMANMQDGHFDLYLNNIYFMDLNTLHMNNTYIRRNIRFNNTNIVQGKINLFDTVKIRLSNPIYAFKKELVDVYIDSIKTNQDISYYFLDNEMTKLRIKLDWIPEANYKFVFKKGCFTDVYDQRIDSTVIEFKAEKEDNYGNLKLEIINDNSKRKLLQLIDSKGNIARTEAIKESRTIEFKQLLPDTYKIKIIDDINYNNEWDLGFYYDRREPEKIYTLENTIIVKEGIDSENIKISLEKIPF